MFEMATPEPDGVNDGRMVVLAVLPFVVVCGTSCKCLTYSVTAAVSVGLIPFAPGFRFWFEVGVCIEMGWCAVAETDTPGQYTPSDWLG